MNNAAYLRVSSDKQTALRQRESLKDLPIDRWYEDSEGSNPRTAPTAAWRSNASLRNVERGFIKTIYVASQDRFGTKDAYELGHFFTLLRKHDCRLLDASGKVLNADDDATVITSTVGALTTPASKRKKRAASSAARLPKSGPERPIRAATRPTASMSPASARTARKSGGWSTRATTAASRSTRTAAPSGLTASETARPRN